MAAFVRIFRNKWLTPPKPVTADYAGKTIIVTGATSGIGEEAVCQFAALGASRVIMTARDLKKGELVKSTLEARLNRTDQLEVWELDMMDYDSVGSFAKRANDLDQLDIVILNAGTRRTTYVESRYRWEEDLQVNMLSTTLLALLLLPKLKEMKKRTGNTPVLEFVNSGLYQNAVVPPEVRKEDRILTFYNRKELFREGSQYKFSKVFLMYATRALADEISSGDVIITSICPGWVITNLGRDHYFPGLFVLAYFFILLLMRTPAQGARTVLSGTSQGEIVHGRFWQHDQIQPIPPSLKGEVMKELGSKIFEEILSALERDVPDLDDALRRAILK